MWVMVSCAMIVGLITLCLVACKLTGIVSQWSWWQVLAPMGFFMITTVITFPIVLAIDVAWEKFKRGREDLNKNNMA